MKKIDTWSWAVWCGCGLLGATLAGCSSGAKGRPSLAPPDYELMLRREDGPSATTSMSSASAQPPAKLAP